MKDFLLGVGGLFVLGTTMAWDYLKKFWKSRSEAQKSGLLAVAIIVIAFSVVGVVRAGDTPDSNFGGFVTKNNATVFLCYMHTPEVKVGPVYTCLVTQPMPMGMLALTGGVTFCTVTNYENDMPFVDCGEYNDMTALSGGV